MSHLPVTIISGFFGAGKTSLLHYFISEQKGGHLAVLVENPGPLNLDSKALRGLCGAMRRAQDSIYEIPNTDAARQMQAIANTLRELAEAGRHERVLIELAGTSGPTWLAREFLPGGAFASFADLTQIVCAIDALDFLRTQQASDNPVLDDFQHEQIVGSTLTVLNKCDLLDQDELVSVRSALNKQFTGLSIIETAYGEIPPEILLRPADADELQRAIDRAAQTVDPSSPESNLASAIYRVHRPFHPQRFWDWFNGNHDSLLRVKGIIWLASRSLLVGGVSRTRWQNGCGAAGIWWAALPREEWPQEVSALTKMQDVWREPYGDRRQEIVIVGDAAYLSTTMRRELDACLLTDAEFSQPLAEWGQFPDPFPAWDVS